jgi:hypothetical protein
LILILLALPAMADTAPTPSSEAIDQLGLELIPRAEFITAQGPFSQRASIRARLRASTLPNETATSWSAFAEGFLERDWVDNDRSQIEQRRSRETTSLDQAWLEARGQRWFLRLGRQPVRWNDRLGPAPETGLDWLSGRRWNRLFVDPPAEALTHPDAARLHYGKMVAGRGWEADLIHVVQNAQTVFPEPFDSVDRRSVGETFVRYRRAGELLGVAASALRGTTENRLGLSFEYENPDFPCCKIWLEAMVGAKADGSASRQSAVFGYSVSANDLTIAPELTVTSSQERIFQVNVHYQMDQWSLDSTLYYLSPSSDEHQSVMIHFESGEWYRYSLFWQRYRGKTGRLFGVYESQTQGQSLGVRAEINYELF